MNLSKTAILIAIVALILSLIAIFSITVLLQQGENEQKETTIPRVEFSAVRNDAETPNSTAFESIKSYINHLFNQNKTQITQTPQSQIQEQNQTTQTYGDGWRKVCYDNGKCAYSNYHTIQRYDGQYIPFESLNISSGQWTYLKTENSTHYILSRLQENLSLPKILNSSVNYSYTFSLNKISFSFIVSPSILGNISKKNGTEWYIPIPDRATKTRFLWDNKKPFVFRNNNQSDFLNDTEYWYSKVNDQIRLNYNQTARDFGIASTNITFSFDSWTVGDGGNAWSGNSSFDGVTQNRADANDIVIGLSADYFNRSNGVGTGKFLNWSLSSTTAIGINNNRMNLTAGGNNAVNDFNGSNYNISFMYNNEDGNIVNNNVQLAILFYRQTYTTGVHVQGYKLALRPSASQLLLYYSYGTGSTLLETASGVSFAKDDVITVQAGTIGTGLKVYANTTLLHTFAGNSSYIYGYAGVLFHNAVASDYPTVDNFRIWNSTIGILTTWHDAGAGNETYQLDINFSAIPTNTNYTTYYRQNATGSYIQIGTANATVNQSITLSTKYQNTDVQVWLFGNTTATPELQSITFWTQAVSGVDTSFTVSFPVGETQAWFNASLKTENNISARNQTGAAGFLNITNTGNVNEKFYFNITSALPSGVTIKADTDNSSVGATSLNISQQIIIANLTQSTSQHVWLWMDVLNADPMNTQRTLQFNSSQV